MNILGVGIFAITVILLIVLPYQKQTFKIITTKDSAAEQYAQKNHIDVEILADTQKKLYTENQENYSYNVYQTGMEITEYKGVSEELVIPVSLDGKLVLSIKEGVLQNNSHVKKVVLPITLLWVSPEDLKNVEVFCYESVLCTKLQEDENLKVTELSDSDYYHFFATTFDFEYNLGNTIEIVKYNGDSHQIIIPETIDGYEVEKVKLKIDDSLESIYIPSTVKSLKLTNENSRYDFLFFLVLTWIMVTFIIYMIITFLSSKKTEKEYFYQAPFLLISLCYLAGDMIFYVLAFYNHYHSKTILLTGIITSILYVIFSAILLMSRNRLKSYDEKVAQADHYIKDTLACMEELNQEHYDEEVLKMMQDVKELIRYSDPITNDKTKTIEKEIQDKILNSENDIAYWREIKKMVQKRNRICKENK